MSCAPLNSSRCFSQKEFSFFFNDTATTEIYTLSLHDALPIYARQWQFREEPQIPRRCGCPNGSTSRRTRRGCRGFRVRSEEHTSELQSQSNLVCRLLLEKKNTRWKEEWRYHLVVAIRRYPPQL